MSNVEMISTDRLDPRDRMKQLPRLLRLYGFGMQPLPEHNQVTVRIDGPNQGRMFTQIEYAEVYGLHCARIKGSAYGLSLSRGVTVKHVPRYGVIAQRIGISRFKLDGQVFELPAGAWCVVDLSRLEELVHEAPFEHLVFSGERVPGQDDRPSDRTSGASQPASGRGAPQLFYDLMVSFFEQISSLNEAACRNIINCMSELCKAALAEDRQDERISSAARRVKREAIARFVNAHLGDHNLCVDSVARAFRCSTRTIQRIFAGTEQAESLNRYIWRSRLERSAISLMTSKSFDRSITEIAETHGFGSVAHFSRIFRKQFNMSPTDYRRRAVGATEGVAR